MHGSNVLMCEIFMSTSTSPNLAAWIEQHVLPLLTTVKEPLTGQHLLALEAISNIQYLDKRLSLNLTLGFPGDTLRKALVGEVVEKLLTLDEVDKVVVNDSWKAPISMGAEGKKPINNVRNVIAVASGKGGVGKSTTTVNLALALVKMGARVGILDADIYGPSQPQMLGAAKKKPEVRDEKAMIPIEAHGLQSMSLGYLLSEKTPAVWRGPMATGALQQMIFQTDWDDLDYLFVDMPPGTGDIQLTLSQEVPVSGAIIVTTPQDIALLDAKKGIEMFVKVDIPVLGVVENMAVHHCTNCGHEEHIFGEGGGARIAADYGTQLLGAMPLAMSIREEADSGRPTVVANPEGAFAQRYCETAQKAVAELWLQRLQASDMPEIVVSED